MAKKTPVPKYIAIVMDGNGRWAKTRKLRRTAGHREGAANVRRIVTAASELGIRELTLYAFSTENWSRSPSEVKFLMKLLEQELVEQREDIMRQNVRFSAIGNLSGLPAGIRQELSKTTEISHRNKGLHTRLALNYGGRTEILDAIKQLRASGQGNARLTEERFRKFLYDPSMHDPDLFIRTGGEMRVSNFLLWQISYAELYFTDVLWPDFGREDLENAIEDFKLRERRYGGL